MGDRFMALFVGPNGSGKSCAAASWPGPIKFFDTDGRMAPIKLMYPLREDIEYDTYGPKRQGNIKSYVDLCEEIEALQDNCPWATVVMDGITSLSNTSITYQLQVRSGNTRLTPKLTKGGLVTASFDEFNGETTTVTQILDVLKVLPCHIIVTAHPVIKTDLSGDKPIRTESLVSYGPKLGSFIPIYFNEIWKFKTRTNGEGFDRIVQTQPYAGDDYCKTALPLPPIIDHTKPKKLFKEVQLLLTEYNLKLAEKIEQLRASKSSQ